MINPLSDVVLAAGVQRFEQLERQKLEVAQKVQGFSRVLGADQRQGVEAVSPPSPAGSDMGAQLVALTKNGMEYSLAARLMSMQLGLYSSAISEGRA